jgi:hypothetical protein
MQTVDEVAAAARIAFEVRPAEVPDADALADSPGADALAKGVDSSDDLVPGHPRICYRKEPEDGNDIGVAHPACLHTDPHLARGRRQHVALDQLKLA